MYCVTSEEYQVVYIKGLALGSLYFSPRPLINNGLQKPLHLWPFGLCKGLSNRASKFEWLFATSTIHSGPEWNRFVQKAKNINLSKLAKIRQFLCLRTRALKSTNQIIKCNKKKPQQVIKDKEKFWFCTNAKEIYPCD